MQIKVEIDPDCQEPIISIKTSQMTEEIGEIIEKLNIAQKKLLVLTTI